MLEKSAAAVQTAPSRPAVKSGKIESLSERLDRFYDAISRRAFDLFERDGRADGNDVRHWLEAESEFLLPVSVSLEESENEFIVRAEVPGFTASELEVNVEPRRVTISGRHESKKEIEEDEAVNIQRSSDEILRTVDLPSEVNTIKVSATLKEGVLALQIPKLDAKKTVRADLQAS